MREMAAIGMVLDDQDGHALQGHEVRLPRMAGACHHSRRELDLVVTPGSSTAWRAGAGSPRSSAGATSIRWGRHGAAGSPLSQAI